MGLKKHQASSSIPDLQFVKMKRLFFFVHMPQWVKNSAMLVGYASYRDDDGSHGNDGDDDE